MSAPNLCAFVLEISLAPMGASTDVAKFVRPQDVRPSRSGRYQIWWSHKTLQQNRAVSMDAFHAHAGMHRSRHDDG